MDTQSKVVDVIRIIATARGLKGPELAKRVGLSKTALYDRFNGITKISVDELAVFAEVLDVGCGDLLRDPAEFIPHRDQGGSTSRWIDVGPGQELRDLVPA